MRQFGSGVAEILGETVVELAVVRLSFELRPYWLRVRLVAMTTTFFRFVRRGDRSLHRRARIFGWCVENYAAGGAIEELAKPVPCLRPGCGVCRNRSLHMLKVPKSWSSRSLRSGDDQKRGIFHRRVLDDLPGVEGHQ